MIFARHGIPLEVCTDGGPQLSSQAFHAFAEQFEFAHVVSSPGFPRSNGLAEKGMNLVKCFLKKALYVNEYFWIAFLITGQHHSRPDKPRASYSWAGG